MRGPHYGFFQTVANDLATEFCEECAVEWCDMYSAPLEKCPHYAKWKSIYDDLDQLIARVTDWKEVPVHDA